MHIIVVGGGPVGDSLVGLALKDGHNVVLVEADEATAEDCAQRHDALVLHASITEDDVFEEAGGSRADALIAATSDDAANLMAMVLGQEAGIDSLTSVVNHKSHTQLFERLGIRVMVDPEVLVAQHLLDLVLYPDAEDVTTLAGREQLFELTLSADSPLLAASLAELKADEALPADLVVASVTRDDEHFFPRGQTRLQSGDRIIVFAPRGTSQDVLSRLNGADS